MSLGLGTGAGIDWWILTPERVPDLTKARKGVEIDWLFSDDDLLLEERA